MKFIEYVKNFREGSIQPKVDKERSLFPFLSGSGHARLNENALQSVLLVPSGKRFILEGIWFWGGSGNASGPIIMYDGSVGPTFPPFKVSSSTTLFLTGLHFAFESGVFMSAISVTAEVQVWGYLIASEAQ